MPAAAVDTALYPQSLVAYGVAHNPSIKAARETWREKIENIRITTAYPDPQVMATWFAEPLETRLGPQEWNLSVTQPIPFPGKKSSMGRVAEAGAIMARITLEQTVREVTANIRASVHELVYIRSAQQIAGLNDDILQHMKKAAGVAYAANRATLTDVVKAQAQEGQLAYDRILLQELEQTEIARLNGLLGKPVDASVDPITLAPGRPLAFALDQIHQLVMEHLEEVKMARAALAAEEEKKTLARLTTLPDFKMGLFYASIGTPDTATLPQDAGRDAIGIQAGITVPLWFGANISRVNAADAGIRAAREKVEAARNKAAADLRRLFFKVRNAERLMALYKEDLLPQAQSALETAETWFDQKQGTFSDFLEAQSTLYNFQLSLARARADYGKQLAALEGMAGRSLTETGPSAPAGEAR